MLGLFSLVDEIERIRLPWMVGGSVAAMCYSEPRATLDVDVILAACPTHVARIQAAFPEEDFYVPPPEVMRHEFQRGSAGCFS